MPADVTAWDKLLPNQPVNNQLYAGPPGAYFRRLLEVVSRSSGIESLGRDFDLVRSEQFSVEEMASNAVSLGFLGLLVQLTGAREVLEIGTFIGLSAIAMARGLPAEGRLTTIERFDRFAAVARENFSRCGLADRITLIEADAMEALAGLSGRRFDLIFLDGNKERYAEYFEALDPLLRDGGLLIVDDALFHGDVLNREPQTEKGRGVRAFLDSAARADSYLRVLLPVANGMMLMLKSSNDR